VHQTAAYDFVLTIILLLVLLRLRRHVARYDGFVITVFGAWYGCQRILEDFLREDRHLLPGLTGSQITSIIVVLVCLWHLIFVRRTPRWGRWDEPKVEPPLTSSVSGESPENEE
jgi:prolipoprotein diacylglyceryltransferase